MSCEFDCSEGPAAYFAILDDLKLLDGSKSAFRGYF